MGDHHEVAADGGRKLVHRAGIPARLGAAGTAGTEPVRVVTMHSAKGAEFQRVIVLHVEDQVVPDAVAIAAADGSDVDDVLQRERFLLYVACSRARDDLVVSWSGQPSRFLAGLVERAG